MPKKRRKRSSGVAFRGWPGSAASDRSASADASGGDPKTSDSDSRWLPHVEPAAYWRPVTDEQREWMAARARDGHAWRLEVAERMAHALRTAKPLDRTAEEVMATRERLRIHMREASDSVLFIDEGWEWSRLDYHCLRKEIGPEGVGAYHGTRHWFRTRRLQRALRPDCERCGARTARRDIHHLHYETVGCERPMVDLVTLCRWCHRAEEGRDPFSELQSSPVAITGPPMTSDDAIPF